MNMEDDGNVFAQVGPTTGAVQTASWRAGACAGLMMLVIALVSGSVLYQLALDALQSEVRDNLIRAAQMAATVVDADGHRQFRSRAQEQGRVYQSAVQALEKVRVAARDIRFIYTCVLVSNRVHFVLDPTPSGDADRDGMDDKFHVMQLYEQPSAQLLVALRAARAGADSQPYKDAWGTFISGYAPFFGKDGKLSGVVGVDLDAARFVQRMGGLRRAAWAGTFLALVLSVMAGLGFHQFQVRTELFRRQIERLNEELERKVAERTAELDSSRKRLEVEVVERRRSEMEALQARRAAEAANRAKSAFLATMTHELRTPMNGVIGMANVLLGTPLDADQTECVEIIKTSGESLLGVVDNILDYTMVEGEELGTEVLPYDPREVVQTVVGTLEDRAKEKQIGIEVRIAPGLPGQLVSDSARVRQVLMNLLDNAIKFTNTGTITVEARVTDHASNECGNGSDACEYVCFSVTDTGVGVSSEKQDELFLEFAQGDSTAGRQHGGLGLGLALCKRLVQLDGRGDRHEERAGPWGNVLVHAARRRVCGAVAIAQRPAHRAFDISDAGGLKDEVRSRGAGYFPRADSRMRINPPVDLRGLTIARLNRSGLKKSRATARTWAGVTVRIRCIASSGGTILP